MAFKKELYDENWKDTIRPAVLQRANFKCENCGVRQRQLYYTDKGARINVEDTFVHSWCIKNGIKVKKIFLAVSHQNHITTDNRPENLKALCQFCHLKHDKDLHKVMRMGKRASLPPGQSI